MIQREYKIQNIREQFLHVSSTTEYRPIVSARAALSSCVKKCFIAMGVKISRNNHNSVPTEAQYRLQPEKVYDRSRIKRDRRAFQDLSHSQTKMNHTHTHTKPHLYAYTVTMKYDCL